MFVFNVGRGRGRGLGLLLGLTVLMCFGSLFVAVAARAAPPQQNASGLEFGLTSGGADPILSATAGRKLGAKSVGVEFAIGTPASGMRTTIAAYAANGIRVLPLAGFHGRVPTAAEARNLAGWASEFGPGGTFWANRADGRLAVRLIEFGSETSYAHQGTQGRAGEYALRFRDAFNAIQGPGGNPRTGLLAQADDGGSGSPKWVNAMFDAVPGLAGMVSGWTVHPYGPQARWQAKMDRLVSQTAARGASSTIPIDITEWGLATDGGRCLSDNYGWDKCMSYAAAATALRSTVSGMTARYGARLRSFNLYQATDQLPSGPSGQREHYFGALKRDLSDKGAFSSEVRALNAASK